MNRPVVELRDTDEPTVFEISVDGIVAGTITVEQNRTEEDNHGRQSHRIALRGQAYTVNDKTLPPLSDGVLDASFGGSSSAFFTIEGDPDDRHYVAISREDAASKGWVG